MSEQERHYHTRRTTKQHSAERCARKLDEFIQPDEDPQGGAVEDKTKRGQDDEKIKSFIGFKIELEEVCMDEANTDFQGLRKTFKKYIDRKLVGIRAFFDADAIKHQISQDFVAEMEREDGDPLWKQYKYLANETVYKILKREKKKLSELSKKDLTETLDRAKMKSSSFPKKKRPTIPSSSELQSFEPAVNKRSRMPANYETVVGSGGGGAEGGFTDFESERRARSARAQAHNFSLARVPDLHRSLFKSVVSEDRLKRHMVHCVARNGEKLEQDGITAMAGAVNQYFIRMLGQLYHIARKRNIGAEMRGKLAQDVGLNTFILKAHSSQMNLKGPGGKAHEELKETREVELRFGLNPAQELKDMEQVRNITLRELMDPKRVKKQKGPKLTAWQEFENEQKVEEIVRNEMPGDDELDISSLKDSGGAGARDALQRVLGAYEEKERKIAQKRKEWANLKLAVMDVRVFPESMELRNSRDRPIQERQIRIEDLRAWLRGNAHFYNNKLHNYIEMNEEFSVKR